MTSRIGQQANYLDGIPVVASTAARDALFPSAIDTNQRVQNLETGYIERYTGTQWVADFDMDSGAVKNVRAYGATGDGTTDDTTAIQAAVTAACTQGKATVYFPPGTYKCGALTIPSSVSNGVAFVGGGGGGDRHATITGTSTTTLMDFGNNAGYVRIENLAFVHQNAAGAGNGFCFKFGDGYYLVLRDVWINGFTTGIQLAGNCIYSSWERVRVTGCYSYGVRHVQGGAGNTYALVNGNTFDDCNFSNTVNGPGVQIDDAAGSAAVKYHRCKFEGNLTSGFTSALTGFLNLKFDTCYFEDNGAIDCIITNAYPNASALVSFDNCYFDPGNTRAINHVRVQATMVRMLVQNCRFYQVSTSYTTPPISFTDRRGTQPCIAINNEYDTATLISGGEDGWVILDSKHPYVSSSTVDPSTLGLNALKAASLHLNSDESTNQRILGWFAEKSGKGTQTNPAGLTGTTVNASDLITLNNTQHVLEPGDYIVVGAVTFNRTANGGGATDAFVRVLECRSGGVIHVDGTATSSASSQAVTYRSATITAIPRVVRLVDNVGVVNNATTTFTLPASGYVLFVCSETNATGRSVIVMASNGILWIVAQDSAALFTVTLTTAGKINFGISGTTVTIENKQGTNNNYTVVAMVVR